MSADESPTTRERLRGLAGPVGVTVALASGWSLAIAVVLVFFGRNWAAATFVLATFGVLIGLAWLRRVEHARWIEPIRELSEQLGRNPSDPTRSWDHAHAEEIRDLIRSLSEFRNALLESRESLDPPSGSLLDENRLLDSVELPVSPQPEPLMTRSGMYDVPPGLEGDSATGPLSSDLVNRLEPRTLRWLESSQGEQEFLGWDLAELREKTFLEIVHQDDRELARQQLRGALHKGEAHGLVYRIRNSRGEIKAVQMNVGVRYGPDMRVSHIRCHLTDITAKLRSDRELRRRTRELIQANEELRRTNRELEELKNRYTDLYQNAPALYFSLDAAGRFVDCNDTMLRSLGYSRSELIGQTYRKIIGEDRSAVFQERFAEFLARGHVEVESEWIKADGQVIQVWLTATAVYGADGQLLHSRSVAQDITARRLLEAELQTKNQRLATANEELSRKNKELDEFTYVVSHDLQEPLRTLIAFSDFLMKDHGDRLDESGKEYVRYLVDASRRLRSLIQDLLSLSRAGKVTGDFAPVAVGEVAEIVRADFAELIRTRNAEIRIADDLPTVWGDRDRIGQLVGNLIANGLKYNRSETPTVEVGRFEASPGCANEATFFVRDNGIGIDPKFHAKIFQLFRRLHTREEYEGTGAGLAICHKIVQAHGGRIWVESQPGQGATFFVSLPRPPEKLPIPSDASSSDLPRIEPTHAR